MKLCTFFKSNSVITFHNSRTRQTSEQSISQSLHDVHNTRVNICMHAYAWHAEGMNDKLVKQAQSCTRSPVYRHYYIISTAMFVITVLFKFQSHGVMQTRKLSEFQKRMDCFFPVQQCFTCTLQMKSDAWGTGEHLWSLQSVHVQCLICYKTSLYTIL